MKILDRYVIREILGPFFLALGLFTFLLGVRPILEYATQLLAKGVALSTVGFLLLTLIPQALGLAIPMAFMAGLLMGLGRLSGDREGLVMLACGVSPLRLLRPLVVLAVLVAATDFYVLAELVPDSNQRFRVETVKLLARQGETDIKPGRFYQGFPGKMIYVRESRPDASGWSGVILADTSDPSRMILTLAASGYLAVDTTKREVSIVLPGESIRYMPGAEEGVYETARATDLRFSVAAESVFGDGTILERGNREMKIADLKRLEEDHRQHGVSPHNEIMQRHQMFSFPVACIVFSLIGLALGLHTRKEGKLGGFTLGIGVIFVYYALMALAEGRTKGQMLPAEWARWVPNIVLGVVAVAAVWWRNRASEEISVRLPAWLSQLGRSRPAADGTAPAPIRPVVLVIRVPTLSLPRPRLLDLYISRKYLAILSLSFFSLLGLYYIGTFIDKSEKLFKGQADSSLLVQYFYYSTPQFLAYVVPMATLVAVLATLGGLTRTGELVVMRACGVSLYRAAASLVILALVWSGGLFFLNDRVLASSNRRAQEIDDRIKGGGTAPMIAQIATTNWRTDKDGRIYYFRVFDIPRRTLAGLSIFETARRPFRLVSHTYANRVVYDKTLWHADQGWEQHFPTPDRSTRAAFGRRDLRLPPPETFAGLDTREADLMKFGELRRHVTELAQSGFNVAESRVTLQSRIAFPLVTLVMTILGIPFGVTTGRRGALYGIGLAVILASAYWLMTSFFTAVGQADLLPAALAAWAANLLFLAVAGYLMLTIRT